MALYTDEHLAKMYTRADVLLAVSLGEGFGVPCIEAQACGTRVIGSNWTATPELLCDDCYLVEGQPEWDGSQLSWWFRPHVASIANALEQAYRNPGHSKACVQKASQYAADDVVLDSWRPLIDGAV
jgi:glycosyltransferase involved in cell wall biosynthesis